MNHQAIIEQLSVLAPKLKAAESPEAVLVKYASDRNLSPAQLERIGQVYNIAKTLNFMDKSASRGDSFKVLDTQKMMADFTTFKPTAPKAAKSNAEWDAWFDGPVSKSAAATTDYTDINSWIDNTEKSSKIVEEDGQYVVYSEDGSKRLSKPGTKEQALKRLRQVEYFKSHKKASTIPNLLAIAHNDEYSAAADELSELPKTAAEQIKVELRQESALRFELETAKQIMDDAADEARKIASELLEMHRLAPLPFAVMEHDAVYCAEDAAPIKEASEFLANFFSSKGWNLERHDFTKGMPKLARDRHNALPLFTSAAEKIELYKSASAYVEHLEKEAMQGTERRTAKQDAGTGEFPKEQGTERRQRPVAPKQSEPISEADLIALLSKGRSDGKGKSGEGGDVGYKDTKDIVGGIASMYNPSSYLNKQTQDYLGNILKAPEPSRINKRQKTIDVAVDDVSRVSELQRLLLSDPIIGEADPDTVVSLYNTLAQANPEIVKDKNLLRFALREALQYDAVPLHTYKDLISMGKDRADMEEKNQKINEKKYSV